MRVPVRFTPRTWGRHEPQPGEDSRRRFTPTHVGTTRSTGADDRSPPVHPHARGDDIKEWGHNAAVDGSPPRMWGRRLVELGGGELGRFTPTHVGTTGTASRFASFLSVHPHARGDDAASARRRRVRDGSPPRTWGRRQEEAEVVFDFRFTPTHVGTTWLRSSSVPVKPVHPHARGDDSCRYCAPPMTLGSPPRTWGRLQGGADGGAADRFTPTDVETTAVRFRGRLPASVHPPARGDDRRGDHGVGLGDGSPPRTWGRLAVVFKSRLLHRFTPTHVGTTWVAGRSQTHGAVHPHARGDDQPTNFAIPQLTGSPPRTWGRQAYTNGAYRQFRFTPTHVGTT